jgi:hypothetical protein
MLYLFYGDDRDTILQKSRELISSLRKKRPDALYFKLDGENFEENLLDELIGGQGLFENRYLILLESLSSDEARYEILLKKMEDISSSPNIFIMVEGKLEKTKFNKLSKFSDKVQAIKLPDQMGEKPRDGFEIFNLANALPKRDRLGLWVLYRQAIRSGASPENINGVLFWKIKTMLSGGFLGKFSASDLKVLSSKLVSAYHKSHRGEGDFEYMLEKIVLAL